MGRLTCNHCGHVMKSEPINWAAAFSGDSSAFPTCEQCGRKVASGYSQVYTDEIREVDPKGRVFEQTKKLFRYETGDSTDQVVVVDYHPEYGIGIDITNNGFDMCDPGAALWLPPDQARAMAEAILKELAQLEQGEGG